MIHRWKDNRNLTCVHIHIAVLHTSVLFYFVPLFKGFLICYKDKEDRIFKKFCTQFLPPDLFLKELDSEQPSNVRLLMVFILPSVNRQNNVEVICSNISQLKKKYHLDGTCVFCVIKKKIMFIVNSHIKQYIQNT